MHNPPEEPLDLTTNLLSKFKKHLTYSMQSSTFLVLERNSHKGSNCRGIAYALTVPSKDPHREGEGMIRPTSLTIVTVLGTLPELELVEV